MGEDFIRKTTDRFQRLRNLNFARLVERHLFSGIPSTESTEAIGVLCAPKPPALGTKVWCQVAHDGSVSFYSGVDECVRFPDKRADQIRALVAAGTVVGEVLEYDPDLGQVRLRLTSLEEKVDERSADPT